MADRLDSRPERYPPVPRPRSVAVLAWPEFTELKRGVMAQIREDAMTAGAAAEA
ncbi:MAG: hypothetical protein ACE5KF_00410 [Kiloniellaceae bacterium]